MACVFYSLWDPACVRADCSLQQSEWGFSICFICDRLFFCYGEGLIQICNAEPAAHALLIEWYFLFLGDVSIQAGSRQMSYIVQAERAQREAIPTLVYLTSHSLTLAAPKICVIL